MGATSDYRLAKLLSLEPTTVSNYRNGRSQASDEIALKLAAAINRAPRAHPGPDCRRTRQ